MSERQCEDCGATYVAGSQLRCPECGARVADTLVEGGTPSGSRFRADGAVTDPSAPTNVLPALPTGQTPIVSRTLVGLGLPTVDAVSQAPSAREVFGADLRFDTVADGRPDEDLTRPEVWGPVSAVVARPLDEGRTDADLPLGIQSETLPPLMPIRRGVASVSGGGGRLASNKGRGGADPSLRGRLAQGPNPPRANGHAQLELSDTVRFEGEEVYRSRSGEAGLDTLPPEIFGPVAHSASAKATDEEDARLSAAAVPRGGAAGGGGEPLRRGAKVSALERAETPIAAHVQRPSHSSVPADGEVDALAETAIRSGPGGVLLGAPRLTGPAAPPIVAAPVPPVGAPSEAVAPARAGGVPPAPSSSELPNYHHCADDFQETTVSVPRLRPPATRHPAAAGVSAGLVALWVVAIASAVAALILTFFR